MPEVPATQKGQLDALFETLGVKDFNAATAAIISLQGNAASNAADQKAFFELIGATDQATALDAITRMQSDLGALFKALGNATDVASALGVITNMQSDRDVLWKALGATDHSTAVAAIGTLNGRVTAAEAAQKDFDARLEKGIADGLVTRAASAGLPAPVAKAKIDEATGALVPTGRPRQRLAQIFNEQIADIK